MGSVHNYTSSLTGSAYVLNTSRVDRNAAQAACQDLGEFANLVSYTVSRCPAASSLGRAQVTPVAHSGQE